MVIPPQGGLGRDAPAGGDFLLLVLVDEVKMRAEKPVYLRPQPGAVSPAPPLLLSMPSCCMKADSELPR